MLSLLVLFVFTLTAHAGSAALGIDFGTEYIKAAIAKPGSPIEIVLTKDSKRKEAASLAFKPSRAQVHDKDAFPERLYGGDALAVSARYPADVYSNLKPLLGVSTTDPAAQAFTNRYPGLQIRDIEREDGGRSVGFTSKNLGKSDPFMVEELLAMELQNIKANAEAMVGKNNFVSDVVITYPSFYTAEEKRALQLAAELAGFRVLALISDGQAVGLNYATTRAFDPKKPDAKPEYHVVYDMGAGSTTATVLKFHGKTIKGPGKKNTTVQEVQVLGVGHDRYLGGDSLNELIVQDMISKFVEVKRVKQLGVEAVHVKKEGKTMARLWKDAEKVRQVLSANSQAAASFEGLFYDDVNFKYTLTRADFEKLAESYALRIAAPLSSALLMADMTMSDLDSVILHGGMTRTPFVQTQLELAAGGSKNVRTNINADEAAAFGAAFKAAGLSASFRVKDIRTADISGFSYTMKWTTDGKEKSQKIFLETSLVGAEKQMTVKSTDDLEIHFLQGSLYTEKPQTMLAVEAANLTKSANELKSSYGCSTSNITTTFNVRLSPFDGLPEITSGSVSCEAQRAKDGGVMDNVKGLFGFGKKDEQAPIVDDAENLDPEEASQTPLPVDDPTSSGTIVSSATVSATKSTDTKASGKAKPSTVNIPLSLKATVEGSGTPPHKSLPLIRQRLTDFDDSDRNAVLRSEALNVLEAFTYRARDYLDDDSFIAFSTDKTRKDLEKQLSKTSEWLYGDGTDAKTQEFKEKLKSLKAIVDPVLRRKDEGSKREQAVEAFRNSLSTASSMVDLIKGSIEKAAEAASVSASSLASDASEAVSSVASSADPGDDLEDEPYTSTIDVGATETVAAKPKPYEYTQEDLTSIEKAYEGAKNWLEDKLVAQNKLTAYDDPAFLVSEIEARSKRMQDVVSDIIMKSVKMQQPPKAKKSKSAKASKSKSKKSSSTSVEESHSTPTDTKDEL